MSQYFQNFPYTTFSSDNQTIVKDIIRAVSLNIIDEGNPNLLYDYYLSDGEKLENVAYFTYGSTQYHWVLVFINGIQDPINDLPQKDSILRELCQVIYGDPDGVHHFEDPLKPGNIVDFLTTPAIPVTNIEYMMRENEKKRKIRVLRPEYLTNFVDLYNKQIAK